MTATDPEALRVAFLVFDVLDSLGRKYHLGGSYASSIHGIPRQTHDIDIVSEIQLGDQETLDRKLAGDFYCDREQIAMAITKGSSFNLVHLETGVKIDIFPQGASPFDKDEQKRSQLIPLGDPPRSVPVKTAEDTILRKLEWYRLGGGVSDRQWGDVLGILETQIDQLNLEYLRSRSPALGVEDLVEKALDNANT